MTLLKRFAGKTYCFCISQTSARAEKVLHRGCNYHSTPLAPLLCAQEQKDAYACEGDERCTKAGARALASLLGGRAGQEIAGVVQEAFHEEVVLGGDANVGEQLREVISLGREPVTACLGRQAGNSVLQLLQQHQQHAQIHRHLVVARALSLWTRLSVACTSTQ